MKYPMCFLIFFIFFAACSDEDSEESSVSPYVFSVAYYISTVSNTNLDSSYKLINALDTIKADIGDTLSLLLEPLFDEKEEGESTFVFAYSNIQIEKKDKYEYRCIGLKAGESPIIVHSPWYEASPFVFYLKNVRKLRYVTVGDVIADSCLMVNVENDQVREAIRDEMKFHFRGRVYTFDYSTINEGSLQVVHEATILQDTIYGSFIANENVLTLEYADFKYDIVFTKTQNANYSWELSADLTDYYRYRFPDLNINETSICHIQSKRIRIE